MKTKKPERKRKPIAYTMIDDKVLPATTVDLGRVWIGRPDGDTLINVGSIAFMARTIDGGFTEDERQFAEDVAAMVGDYVARFKGKAWGRKEAKRGTAK